MAGPRADRRTTDSTVGHLAAAALAALDGADPDPTLDEIAEAIEAGRRPRDPHRPHVLLIDPDRHSRLVLAGALLDGGCQVVVALRTGMAAEYAVRQHRPTVIVVDLDLRPGGVRAGLLLVASLAKEAPEVPLLVMARPDLDAEGMAERAVCAGARRLLSKLDVDGLVAAVRAEHDAFLQAAYPMEGGRRGRPASGLAVWSPRPAPAVPGRRRAGRGTKSPVARLRWLACKSTASAAATR